MKYRLGMTCAEIGAKTEDLEFSVKNGTEKISRKCTVSENYENWQRCQKYFYEARFKVSYFSDTHRVRNKIRKLSDKDCSSVQFSVTKRSRN